MSGAAQDKWLSISSVYRLVMNMHTLVPYYLFPSGRALPAWHYYLEVTRRCNLRCLMCQYIQWLNCASAEEQKKDELTTQEWLDVIDQVPRWGLITFTGGEPFMKQDFLQLLERASARCRVHLITNATLLNEERARRCAELAPRRLGGKGLNFLGVSIDGPRELHDRIRGLDGAFDRSMNGIRTLLEHSRTAGKKCPVVHLTTVIQKDNVDALKEMPRVAAEAGAGVLNLTLEIRTHEMPGYGTENPASFKMSDARFPEIDPVRLDAALQDTRAAAAKAGIELRMPAMPDGSIVEYYAGRQRLGEFRCGCIWTTVFVGRTGNVCPCWLLTLGNVREASVKQLWNGPSARAFRKRTRQGLYPPCVGCCFLVHKGRKGTDQ